MTSISGLAFGKPVTVYGKTIVPVVMSALEAGEHWGLISAVPVAVLVLDGNDCWFTPLNGDISEECICSMVMQGGDTGKTRALARDPHPS